MKSIQQLADVLGCSYNYLYNEIERGKFPKPTLVSGKYRYYTDEQYAYLLKKWKEYLRLRGKARAIREELLGS